MLGFHPVQRDYLISTLKPLPENVREGEGLFPSRPAGLSHFHQSSLRMKVETKDGFHPVQRDYLISTHHRPLPGSHHPPVSIPSSGIISFPPGRRRLCWPRRNRLGFHPVQRDYLISTHHRPLPGSHHPPVSIPSSGIISFPPGRRRLCWPRRNRLGFHPVQRDYLISTGYGRKVNSMNNTCFHPVQRDYLISTPPDECETQGLSPSFHPVQRDYLISTGRYGRGGSAGRRARWFPSRPAGLSHFHSHMRLKHNGRSTEGFHPVQRDYLISTGVIAAFHVVLTVVGFHPVQRDYLISTLLLLQVSNDTRLSTRFHPVQRDYLISTCELRYGLGAARGQLSFPSRPAGLSHFHVRSPPQLHRGPNLAVSIPSSGIISFPPNGIQGGAHPRANRFHPVQRDYLISTHRL